MRKTVLFILFGICLNISAQKVKVDRIENDGRRQLMTSSKSIMLGKKEYTFSLKLFTDVISSEWCLLISSFSYISPSAEVLIKLSNDEIIHLYCNNVNDGKINMPGYGIPIGNITYYSPASQENYYSSIYIFSTEDLEKIETYEIKKIRFSPGTDFYDKEFSNNTLGKFIKKGRKKILEKLKNTPTTKNIYDGF